jgi:hypothetical protein
MYIVACMKSVLNKFVMNATIFISLRLNSCSPPPNMSPKSWCKDEITNFPDIRLCAVLHCSMGIGTLELADSNKPFRRSSRFREEPLPDQKQTNQSTKQRFNCMPWTGHACGSMEKEIFADSRHKIEQDDDGKRVEN